MLEDQIQKDYVQAMKDRNSVRSSTLNFLRSQMKYVKIEKKVEQLADADVVGVIKKQIKQRQDSIEQYTQGARQDLADKESQELVILKSYLPQEMPETEIQKLIDDTIKETNAQSMKDMGNVMKALNPKLAGRADNKIVGELVKKALTR